MPNGVLTRWELTPNDKFNEFYTEFINCMFSKGFGQIGDKNKRGFRSQIPSFCSLSNL